MQRVDHVDRRRVVVGARRRAGRVLAPVGEDRAEVEVPRAALLPPGEQPLLSTLADRERRQAGRAVEAFLGAAEGDVDTCRVEPERLTGERRHAVD